MARKGTITLTEEDYDRFEYYADITIGIVDAYKARWKKHFSHLSSQRAKDDRYTIEWALYQEYLADSGIPPEKLGGFKKPGDPEQIERGRLINAIYHDIFSIYLQGAEYVEACRKTSSIMSRRTWANRRLKAEVLANLIPIQRPSRPRRTRADIRKEAERITARQKEKWLPGDEHPDEHQEDMNLRGAMSGVTETPITELPPQTTVLERHPNSTEVTLLMMEIDTDASFEQKRVTEGGYIPPARYFKKPRKKSQKYKAYRW